MTNRHYAKSHEWVRIEGSLATVGISDHAQKEVTDVVYVELPKVGKAIAAGAEAATMESVKAAFSIYAPVSGTIAKVNTLLEGDPGLINRSPYDQGWMFALTVTDPVDLSPLMTEDAYQSFLKSPEASGHH